METTAIPLPDPRNPFQPPSTEPNWYRDPSGVWAFRWFDGTRWGDRVSDGTGVFSDEQSLTTAALQFATSFIAAPQAHAAPPCPSTAQHHGRRFGWRRPKSLS